jgi:SAM-dependent methyltransferase
MTQYNSENISLYKRLVHPDDRALSSVASELAQDWRILDVGIGGGWTTAALLKALAADARCPSTIEFVGVDRDDQMIHQARAVLKEAGFQETSAHHLEANLNNHLVKIKLCQQEFLDGFTDDHKFDLCLSFFFLHHLSDDWHTGIRKIATLLKPDGRLILTECEVTLRHGVTASTR